MDHASFPPPQKMRGPNPRCLQASHWCAELLSMPSPTLQQLTGTQTSEILEQVEIQVKYDVYIEKEKELVQRMSQLEDLEIPSSFDYNKLSSLSTEALQKFKKIKPQTLGQASRISGVNPSDVQILMVYMGR